MLMTTSVSSARSVASGPSSDCVAARIAKAHKAKAEPAPRPSSAAGCTVAANTSRSDPTRPAIDRYSVPPTDTAMPSHASAWKDSPRKISAMNAACTASVFEYAVPTAKPRWPKDMISRLVPKICPMPPKAL